MRRGRSTRGLRRALLVPLSVGLVGGSAAGIHAAFSNSTSNPTSSFSAKRIFPGERSTSTWVMTDSATGANSLIVKLYAKNSGGRGVQVDNVAFKSTYSFD